MYRAPREANPAGVARVVARERGAAETSDNQVETLRRPPQGARRCLHLRGEICITVSRALSTMLLLACAVEESAR
eukprot:926530-Pyramimonas_sp.AAC.1